MHWWVLNILPFKTSFFLTIFATQTIFLFKFNFLKIFKTFDLWKFSQPYTFRPPICVNYLKFKNSIFGNFQVFWPVKIIENSTIYLLNIFTTFEVWNLKIQYFIICCESDRNIFTPIIVLLYRYSMYSKFIKSTKSYSTSDNQNNFAQLLIIQKLLKIILGSDSHNPDIFTQIMTLRVLSFKF